MDDLQPRIGIILGPRRPRHRSSSFAAEVQGITRRLRYNVEVERHAPTRMSPVMNPRSAARRVFHPPGEISQ